MTFVLGLVLSACGFNVQTNLPYTPAEGVNLSVGSVQIRNLLVVSRGDNEGFVSATMSSTKDDSLVAVSGTVIKSDGSNGAAITGTIPTPVTLTPGVPVVLTDSPAFVTLAGRGHHPGPHGQPDDGVQLRRPSDPHRAGGGGEPPLLRDREPVALLQQLNNPPSTKLGSIDSDTPLAVVVHAHFRGG